MTRVLTLTIVGVVVGVYWKGVRTLVAHSEAWQNSGRQSITVSGIIGFLAAAVILALFLAAASVAPQLWRDHAVEPRSVLIRLAVALIFSGVLVLWMLPKII